VATDLSISESGGGSDGLDGTHLALCLVALSNLAYDGLILLAATREWRHLTRAATLFGDVARLDLT
jgi:hypothetical protein